MTHTRTALLIGGGIAGPVAAMALQKAGIDSVIYEAHADTAEGIGSFLTVASNGLRALRILDVDQPVIASSFSTPTIVLGSGTGKRLGRTATGPLDGGTIGRTISRADLYRAVHDEARRRGIRIEHGKRLVDARPTAEGVLAVFEDGSQATGDLLIGCDGVHSAVRRILDPTAPAPTYTGLINFGGNVSGISVDSEPGVYHMIFGKRAFFGYVAAPGGEVWWFANVPQRDEPARGELESVGTAEWHRRLANLFATDAGPAAGLIAATEHDLAASSVHAIPHLPTWHKQRMIVIGDAAHAPSPTSGQGASLAIEDAIVLAKCLRDLPDPEQAFASYEAQRRSRVERIIKNAARINSGKAAGPVGRVLRDLLMPVAMKLVKPEKMTAWQYDYRIDWDAPVADGSPFGSVKSHYR
jgi:FAD-dependent urate hydroxylase